MSDIAILTAVPEVLITTQGGIGGFGDWNDNNCKAMPNGRPDPAMQSIFAAVHITERQTVIKVDDGIHEELWGIGVTITKRIEAVPYDRITGSIYLTQLSGLSPVMQRVVYEIHNRWKVINAINAAIPFDPDLHVDAQSFRTPLLLINRTPKISFEAEEWFHGTHSHISRDAQDGFVGVSMTAYFGKMLKQTILTPEVC